MIVTLLQQMRPRLVALALALGLLEFQRGIQSVVHRLVRERVQSGAATTALGTQGFALRLRGGLRAGGGSGLGGVTFHVHHDGLERTVVHHALVRGGRVRHGFLLLARQRRTDASTFFHGR